MGDAYAGLNFALLLVFMYWAVTLFRRLERIQLKGLLKELKDQRNSLFYLAVTIALSLGAKVLWTILLGHFDHVVKATFVRWLGFELVAFLTDIPTIFVLYIIHYYSFKTPVLVTEEKESQATERDDRSAMLLGSESPSVYTSETSIYDVQLRTNSNATGTLNTEAASKNARLMSVLIAVDMDFAKMYTQEAECALRMSARIDPDKSRESFGLNLNNSSKKPYDSVIEYSTSL